MMLGPVQSTIASARQIHAEMRNARAALAVRLTAVCMSSRGLVGLAQSEFSKVDLHIFERRRLTEIRLAMTASDKVWNPMSSKIAVRITDWTWPLPSPISTK